MRSGLRGLGSAIAISCASVVGASVLATEAWSIRPRGQDELSIRVWKSRREMVLQEGDRVIRRFQIVLGKNPRDTKVRRGDGRTPVGRYYVSEKRPQSRFRRFLGINYPNIEDAEKGLASQLISADEWADIFFANLRQTTPPWSTALGGRVGIHGFGGRTLIPVDWTEGCIAVSDPEIDYLYDRVPIGTPVIIDD